MLIIEDDVATEKVQEFLKNFTYLKNQFEILDKTLITYLDINVGNKRSRYFEGQIKYRENFNIPVLEISKLSERLSES